MLNDLFDYLKNPVYQEDANTEYKYRLTIFFKLLGLSVAVSMVLGLVVSFFQNLFHLDFGEHAIEEALEKYPLYILFLGAVFAAPIIEELIFRGPLLFFKGFRYFKYIFYLSICIFGFYHITNFEITTTTLVFSPLLVAPQLSVGIFLGFLRVRFGLVWAIALHAAYNLVLLGPVILLKFLDIPLE